jgi:1,4-alpha-glucan branching enzyme
VPRHGFWREMINTNSTFYAGTGVGNDGGRNTEEVPRDGFSQSINLTLPPHTTFIFKWSANG